MITMTINTIREAADNENETTIVQLCIDNNSNNRNINKRNNYSSKKDKRYHGIQSSIISNINIVESRDDDTVAVKWSR